jgi:hypothetical protein
MTVLRDDGVNRHVRFRNPDSSNMFFDLITWPQCLCYTGDMGTYVFRRTEDMFKFFRASDDLRAYHQNKGRKLAINLHYWAEKLESVDRCDGFKEYSPEVFRNHIKDLIGDEEIDPELRAAIEADLITPTFQFELEARDAVAEFNNEHDEIFRDFWEANLTEYTYRFVWCCYALVWGIEQYDVMTQSRAEA